MTETYPAFAGAGAKLQIFPPGTRTVAIARTVERSLRSVSRTIYGPCCMFDYVYLTPHMRGDWIVFAGYHALSDTWYYTDE